jgi:hypothetical protein
MAKKKARQISREKTSTAAVSSNLPKSSNLSSISRGPVFNPDYSPVIRDLKRIGILAGSFVAILVVLSFFLR